MKMPSMKPMKMPMPPGGRALEAGQKVLAAFAHHAPANMRLNPRMDRPGKPSGPRNG